MLRKRELNGYLLYFFAWDQLLLYFKLSQAYICKKMQTRQANVSAAYGDSSVP